MHLSIFFRINYPIITLTLTPFIFQCHAEGGATKGGGSKCEQTQANADKRGQTQANAEAKTQANASKREQTWTNANKRLHPPLLRFFTPPFAILMQKSQNKVCFSLRKSFLFPLKFKKTASDCNCDALVHSLKPKVAGKWPCSRSLPVI